VPPSTNTRMAVRWRGGMAGKEVFPIVVVRGFLGCVGFLAWVGVDRDDIVQSAGLSCLKVSVVCSAS